MADIPDLSEILPLLGQGAPASAFESEHLEFKEPSGEGVRKTLELLADAAVCFANAAGGTIVFGVNDRATVRSDALVGVASDYTIEVLRRGIFDRTTPPIAPFAQELSEDGVRLVEIRVPGGLGTYSNTRGRATRRVGVECRPFTPDQQREVLIARGQYDWSAQPAQGDESDLDSVEIERLRRMLAAEHEDVARLRDRPLLESLGLVHESGSLTYAAILIVGREDAIRRLVPNHGYAYQFRPTPGSEATTRFRQNGPVLAAVDQLISAVESRVQAHPLNLAGGVQVQLSDYPPGAVREIVVNALIHRSYDAPGELDVQQSSEGLIVASPGGLVEGVTPDNILTHPSTPRHRLLADVVTRCRVAERTGQGVDRAYREMLRVGKRPPTFADTGLEVTVNLPGGIGNDAFVRFVSDLPADISADVEVLLALSALREKASIDAPALSRLIQRSPAEANTVLVRLSSDAIALLEPTRATMRRPFPSFRLRQEALASLGRALGYRRLAIDAIDAKVIEHVCEYDFVTNRTLQRMFDVHVFAARDLLVDLRRREILAKIGEARGGTGVKYGPGRRFPRR